MAYEHQNSTIISLNVRGKCFTVKLSALRSKPESFLGKLFSNSFDTIPKLPDGSIFLDFDPYLFSLMLRWLCDHRAPHLKDLSLESQLISLASAVGLDDLVKEMQMPWRTPISGEKLSQLASGMCASGCDFRKVLLRGRKMDRWDLSYGIFTEMKLDCPMSFKEANLFQSNFDKASLCSADLYAANLMEATLLNSNLSRANFTKANLSSAILQNANCSNSSFASALLVGADLTGTNFTEANLSGASLKDAIISNATVLRGCNLANVDISSRDFRAFDLSQVNFSGGNLTECGFFCSTPE